MTDFELAGAAYETAKLRGAVPGEAFYQALAAFRVQQADGERKRALASRPAIESHVPKLARALVDYVASSHGIHVDDLCGADRRADLVRVRDEAAWLLRSTGAPLKSIGRALGGRDHSTVLVAIRRFEARMKADDLLAERMRQSAEGLAA